MTAMPSCARFLEAEGLAPAVLAAYRRLVALIWDRASLPDDDRVLAKVAKVRAPTWRRFRRTLASYFLLVAGRWRHAGIDAFRAGRRRAGAQGAARRWGSTGPTEIGAPASLHVTAPAILVAGPPAPVAPPPFELTPPPLEPPARRREAPEPEPEAAPCVIEGQVDLEDWLAAQPPVLIEPVAAPVVEILPPRRVERRAQRLPEDWCLTDKLVAFGRREGLDDATIEREAERFKDHWLSSGGANARKLDWSRAFQNWLRGAIDRLRAPGGAGRFRQGGQGHRGADGSGGLVAAAAAVLHRRRRMEQHGF